MNKTLRLWLCTMLALGPASACKNGKESATAKNPAADERNPSGVVSVEGMYAQTGGAGVFEDCATGVKWVIAQEGDNSVLEKAYEAANGGPGEPLLVTIDARLDVRRKADGLGRENVLIVHRFDRTWPRETCGSLTPARLQSVYWGLLELNGKPITVPSNGTAPYLELNPAKKSAYGFGGCNRFFGSYELGKHDALTFGALGATRMACPNGMNQEQELFNALGKTTRYEIHGSKLVLYADQDAVARFQARNLLKTD